MNIEENICDGVKVDCFADARNDMKLTVTAPKVCRCEGAVYKNIRLGEKLQAYCCCEGVSPRQSIPFSAKRFTLGGKCAEKRCV